MKIPNAFDNLHVFFDDSDKNEIDVLATVYKDENGIITEIRIFNQEYEEFLVVDRDGKVEAVNISEHEQLALSKKK